MTAVCKSKNPDRYDRKLARTRLRKFRARVNLLRKSNHGKIIMKETAAKRDLKWMAVVEQLKGTNNCSYRELGALRASKKHSEARIVRLEHKCTWAVRKMDQKSAVIKTLETRISELVEENNSLRSRLPKRTSTRRSQ
jgi:hypothetical protein